jgi:integrase
VEGWNGVPVPIHDKRSALGCPENGDRGPTEWHDWPREAANLTDIPNIRQKGTRLGNWLPREQAKELLTVPDRSTLKGKRDYVILALLVGCALRRNELAELEVETIQQREGRWVLGDLEGKGRRVRTVAVPIWVKQGIEAWMAAAGINKGRLLRSVSKSGKVNRDSLSDWAVWSVVEQSSKQIGIKQFGAHDLRRYAVSRIMPDRNLRTPEYWVILDRKGERIRHYRGPSNRRNLSLGRHRRLGDTQKAWKSMIARMPQASQGSFSHWDYAA